MAEIRLTLYHLLNGRHKITFLPCSLLSWLLFLIMLVNTL